MKTERAVLIRYRNPAGERRRASGLRIGGKLVLTADHCASGSGHIVVVNGQEYAATVYVRSNSEAVDVAVLNVRDLPELEMLEVALVDQHELAHLDQVLVAGFPRWKKSPRAVNDGTEEYLLASVRGSVPTSENIPAYGSASTLLSFKITDPEVSSPVMAGGLDQNESMWAGFSGAGVVTADDVLIGVICSHTRSEGPRMLSIAPLAAIDTLDQEVAQKFWNAMGISDHAQLVRIPVRNPAAKRLNTTPKEPQAFLDHIQHYCLTLPQWVPSRLSFRSIWQPLDMISTSLPEEKESRRATETAATIAESVEADTDTVDSSNSEERVAPTLFLISGPGTGKSWYLRHLALEAAERYSAGDPLRPLPVLVSARLLESALADDTDTSPSYSSLTAAIARALPHGLAGSMRDAQINDLKHHLETRAILLLIDGYDEIPQAGAKLGELLPRICSMISANEGRVIVTSRPASVPIIWDVSADWFALRPLTLQQRIVFVQAWFTDDEKRCQQLTAWLRTNRFEALSSPLLLTLFCSDAEERAIGVAPASTEHSLWARALRFLAGQSHHDRPMAPGSSAVRYRINLLTEVARLFVHSTEIATEVDVEEIRRSLNQTEAWHNLQLSCGPNDPLEDLLSSGVVYISESGSLNGIGFFHSACRDYLIARSLCDDDSWMDFVPRIWSQPEWEPVFRYLGAVHFAPNDILQTLVWQFESDPFNAARFAAGGLVAGALVDTLECELQRQVTNELLIVVGSLDAEDGRRAVLLLASIGGDEILLALTNLLNPSLGTRIIVRAVEALSAWPYDTATHALRGLVLSGDFTGEEREAAVRSIASIGTALAGDLIREFAESRDLPARTRATAAISALRSFNDPVGTLLILRGDSDSDLASQRLLAERLATDASCLKTLNSQSDYDRSQVCDPYAAAVLGWVQSQTTGRAEFVSRVSTSPGVKLSLQRIDELYNKTETDFAYASFLHFVLEESGQESALRLEEIWPHVEEASTCEEAWVSYIADGVTRSDHRGAQFLARLTVSGPPVLQERIRTGVANGQLQELVGSLARAMPKDIPRGSPPKQGTGVPRRETRPGKAVVSNQLSVEELLDSEVSSAEQYSVLRARQREINSDGRIFERLAYLTDKVSTKFASGWIDCAPAVAPALEARLLQARTAHRSCEIELTNLRAHWPGRWREAVNTSRDPEPEILSAVATAYFVAGEYEDAQTAALSAIGAATVRKTLVSRQTVIALAGSSALVGGFNDLVYPWVLSRARNPTSNVHDRVAAAWCILPHDPGKTRQICDGLPRWAQAGSADYLALRYCVDGEWPDDTSTLTSWFEVQRTERALRAMLHLIRDRDTRTKAEFAANSLAQIAVGLAKAWPNPRTYSPTDIGRERWHWAVSSRATALLLDGKHDDAAQLFLSLVEDSPHDAVLLNNYAFCMMSLNEETAVAKLKEAALAFGYPWIVNVVNRMLISYRSGEYADALRLGRLYAEGGGRPAAGTATLWGLDDPKTVLKSVDPEAYMFEIARRCLRHTDDEDMSRFWRRYERSHNMAGIGDRDNDL